MIGPRGVAKIAGAVAAAAGVAAAGYAGERVLASRLRHRPDGDAARALEPPVYVDRRLDAHDGGSIYLVETGDGPPIVLSHGVTNSIRSWFHQLDALPDAGFRAIAYDHRGHGELVGGARPAIPSRTSPRTCAPSSRDSICATRCSSAIRWAASRWRRS